MLTDLRQAVDKAISEGTTIQQFRKDFDAIVKKTGWAYNGNRNWRTQVIYDTNLRQAHHAGRWAQIQRGKKRRPFLQYRHGGSVDPRKQHLAWNGTILPVDHPFWETHYPQNGWGCRCSVRALSQSDLDKKQLTVSESPPQTTEQRTITKDGIKQTVTVPQGIDPGFDYNVGKAWYRPFTPTEDAKRILKLATKPPDLPLPTATPADTSKLLPEGLTNEQYANRVLAEFGSSIGKPVPFKDKAGGNLLISEQLFKDYKGNWKIQKNGRERYLLLLTDAIKEPDEIWIAIQPTNPNARRHTLRRRYVKLFSLEDDKLAVAVFEWGKHTWASGISLFQGDNLDYLKQLRNGTMVWKK